MKRLLFTLITVSLFSIAEAITLFPHFTDVAGDFKDGTTEKFTELNLPTDYWRVSPSFFSDIASADSFLMDTLPFSSYIINKEKKTLDDGTEIIIYRSSLEADGLNKGKYSSLILIQTPKEPLYIGIAEDKI